VLLPLGATDVLLEQGKTPTEYLWSVALAGLQAEQQTTCPLGRPREATSGCRRLRGVDALSTWGPVRKFTARYVLYDNFTYV
jgi:hypothetical protein